MLSTNTLTHYTADKQRERFVQLFICMAGFFLLSNFPQVLTIVYDRPVKRV